MKRNKERKNEDSINQRIMDIICILTMSVRLYDITKRSGVVIDFYSFLGMTYIYTKQKWNKYVPAFLCLPSKRKKRSLFSTPLEKKEKFQED